MSSVSMANGFFAALLVLIIYGVSAFVIWKFYVALRRIGIELSEIKQVLRERQP